MSNRVITVEPIEDNGEPRTAIVLQELTYIEIDNELSLSWCWKQGMQYKHNSKEYEISPYFDRCFQNYKALKSSGKRKCYKVLIGDRKLIITGSEVVDQCQTKS